jgi:hypothetical protein
MINKRASDAPEDKRSWTLALETADGQVEDVEIMMTEEDRNLVRK